MTNGPLSSASAAASDLAGPLMLNDYRRDNRIAAIIVADRQCRLAGLTTVNESI